MNNETSTKFLHIRCTPSQLEAWKLASGGERRLSEWVIKQLNLAVAIQGAKQ